MKVPSTDRWVRTPLLPRTSAAIPGGSAMRLSRQALSRQVASVVIAFVATLSALALPADAKVGGINGQIVFARFSPALNGTVVYTINPDGSGMKRLSPGNFGFAGNPHWSPDGSSVAFFSQAGLPFGTVSAVIAHVTTRPL